MRIIFCGTPQFALPALERLLAAGFTIDLVVTNPDEPSVRWYERKAPRARSGAAFAQGGSREPPRGTPGSRLGRIWPPRRRSHGRNARAARARRDRASPAGPRSRHARAHAQEGGRTHRLVVDGGGNRAARAWLAPLARGVHCVSRQDPPNLVRRPGAVAARVSAYVWARRDYRS